MEERRSARVGTVSGLALLTGGTAVAAVAGGAHTVFATVLLGLLTLGLGHSVAVEIQRQARRLHGGWARHDTVNAALLGLWAEAALIMTIIEAGDAFERAVGLALALGYAVGCGYFVNERRRTIRTTQPAPTDQPPAADQSSPVTGPSRTSPSSPAARSPQTSPSSPAASTSPADGSHQVLVDVEHPTGAATLPRIKAARPVPEDLEPADDRRPEPV